MSNGNSSKTGKNRIAANTIPDRILAAARDLFSAKGFQQTTIRDIAQKAHVNGAAINYYFRSKDRLYEEIFLQEYGRMALPLEKKVSSVQNQEDWENALRKWLDCVLELFLFDTPERNIFRCFVTSPESIPAASCEHIYGQVVSPMLKTFRTLLRMAVPDADSDTFQAIFLTVLGQSTCFIHRDTIWTELTLSNQRSREEWARLLCDQILANITARFSYQMHLSQKG